MTSDNPYSPPAAASHTEERGPEAHGDLGSSGLGWDLRISMARWMRIAALLELICAVLLAGSGLGLLATKPRAASLAGASSPVSAAALGCQRLAFAALFLLGAIWLGQAARCFYRGVLSEGGRSLHRAFSKLRLYLVLFGMYSMTALLAQIARLVRNVLR